MRTVGIAAIVFFAYFLAVFDTASWAETGSLPQEQITWSMQILEQANSLLNLMVIIGSIAIAVLVALLAAVIYFGNTVIRWHFEHREIHTGMQQLESVLDRSRDEAVSLTQKLGLPALVDLKLDQPKASIQAWIAEVERSRSVEEIDQVIQVLRLLVNLTPEVFLALGHYYRYQAGEIEVTGSASDLSAAKLLETAVRRYEEAATIANGQKRHALEGAAYQNMAVCFEKLGRFTESLVAAEKAVKLRESTGDLHYLLYDSKGIALISLGQYDEAINAFKVAVSLSPDQPRPHYNLACAYTRASDSIPAPEKARYFELALTELEGVAAISEVKKRAPRDPDLASLRNDPSFGPRFAQLWASR